MKTCPMRLFSAPSASTERTVRETPAATETGVTSGWVLLGHESQFQGRGPFGASAAGLTVVLVRTAAGLRAFDGLCPHQGALLAEGELCNGELVCRNHGWRFDAATGERRGGQGCLRSRPVEVRGGEVFVRIAPGAESAAPAGRLRTVDDLPGPRGWPVLGNAPGLDLERLHATLEQWAERHGPTYRVRLGGHRVVVTADPELVQRSLRERPDTYRRFGTIEPVFRELAIDGVFSAEGLEWRPLRRLTMEALAPAHLRAFYPALREVAERLHSRWSAAADEGRVIDVVREFRRFTIDVTARLAFNHDVNTLQRSGDALQRNLDLVLPGITRRLFAAVPLWRWVKLPGERRFEAALVEVLAFLRERLDATRVRLASDPEAASRPANFLEAMVCARDEAGRPFSDRQILGNAIQMLVAGEDTTSLTLSWAVHELCDAPSATAALRAEADARLAGAVAPPDFDAARTLRVAEAVATEAMRLRAVAPIILQEANWDTVLGDLALRRGQRLFLLTRAPALSGENFVDPHAFRPERWLDATPTAAHDAAALFPFGSGPRLCPGRTLALLEMRVALATLYRSFDVERVGDRTDVVERYAFTMGPRGLQVRLRRRASA